MDGRLNAGGDDPMGCRMDGMGSMEWMPVQVLFALVGAGSAREAGTDGYQDVRTKWPV